MKRLMALLLMLCIALTGMALAEDELYEEVDDSEFNEDAVVPVVGAVYPDKVLSDFDSNSPALYTARMTAYTSGYVERDIESERVFRVGDASARGEVLYIDPTWVIMRYQGNLAYVKRHRIFSVTPVDSSTTPPYGTQKHAYVAKTAATCYVRKSMSDQDESWVVLNPGTTISIWCMYDGWAVVNYMRSYGYINLDQLTDLTPVSPTDNPLREDTPIAAYTSYYKMVDTEKNHNRIFNIARGSELISGIYQPGDIFDGNKIMGPYNKGKGYLPAGALGWSARRICLMLSRATPWDSPVASMTWTVVDYSGPNPEMNGVASGVIVGKTLWIGSNTSEGVAYRTLPEPPQE